MKTSKASATSSKRTYLDNTKISDYKKCPRYYYLRHVKDWTAATIGRPLIFGAAWHAAMTAVWEGFGKMDEHKLLVAASKAFMKEWIKSGGPAEMSLNEIEEWGARTPMVAQEMLINYVSLRGPMLAKMKLLTAEQPFAVPIFSDRDDVWLIGRKDKRVVLNGSSLLIEHKTTTEYKIDGGFKVSFIESFSPNSQLETYLYADRVSEKKPAQQIWVDAALVHKKVHDAFKFIPISYATEAMEAFVWETRDWASRILSEHERARGMKLTDTHMTAFPKNDWSCQGRFGQCQFLDICRSVPNPAKLQHPPEGYKIEHWEPFDTLGLDKIMEK